MSFPKNKRNPSRISDVITSVVTHEGELLEIYYHINTGRVIKRAGVDEDSGIQHAGIILGADKYGNFWIAHNYHANKKPVIDPLKKFSAGSKVVVTGYSDVYTSLVTAKRTLNEVLKAKKYSSVSYNSETFIELIITGKSITHTATTLSEGMALIGILSVFLRILE